MPNNYSNNILMMKMSLFILYPLIMLILLAFPTSSTSSFNVLMGFGAKPNGLTDSTEAFLRAWEAACASTHDTLIYVPKGRYLLRPLVFKGPCKSPHITFRIDGTLVAPQDYRVLGRAQNWLNFQRVTGVSIVGGALDAKGPALWACKANSAKSCPSGATTLSITYSKDIKITGLLSLNSQMFHIVINHCENVEMRGVRIIAHRDSPNTDGIHVQLSKNVAIFNSAIGTGDDCVSIGPGTQNLWIERMACGPGHGISIGSLAKDMNEEGVQNVTVKQVVFTGTQNGIRIKSWAKPSKGFVESVHFSNIVMRNVQNPIIIDQNYCPSHVNCPDHASGIKIKDITYENIKGTSATTIATKFDCSPGNPCSGIRLEDVNLTFQNKPAQSLCANAKGISFGTVLPNSCLSN
ncbi:polygalacturonase-like [Cannabis sativa]|uniref:polygalacturonase-like n=1 Tax=Cannabis sativa TaxID=3483 RepID=UPI0029CA8D99|nr:polygalacturonase-like [Cannabis sativa]